jgi:single-stranded-DNA-specific exonuclease
LDTRNVDAFRNQLIEYVNARLGPEDLVQVLDIDAECALGDLNLPFIEQIERLAPFGRDNPSPIFCLRDVALDQGPQRVGSDGSHVRLALRQGRHHALAIGFGLAEQAGNLVAGERIDVAFMPKMSTWKGRRQIELHVKDFRAPAKSKDP